MVSEALGRVTGCRLCPRECRADRAKGELGYCRMPMEPYAARAALHHWEEPCISGTKGSGAVFFSGCTLRCVYCQNQKIAEGTFGERVSEERLSEIFLELEEQGAHNLNLVTAGHFLPSVIEALRRAKARGLHIGEQLVLDCIARGKAHGFRILQFNAVVRTNTHARHLYERLGFQQLGVIPGGFLMKDGHYEDICPYYRVL